MEISFSCKIFLSAFTVWSYCNKNQSNNVFLYSRNVQWRPFHPCEQTQVPFLHCPCSAHRKSQGNWSQRFPVHPELQRHFPDSQTPFGPQSRLHTSARKTAKGNIASVTKHRKYRQKLVLFQLWKKKKILISHRRVFFIFGLLYSCITWWLLTVFISCFFLSWICMIENLFFYSLL